MQVKQQVYRIHPNSVTTQPAKHWLFLLVVLQDTLDETLPDTLHMTGIYLTILLTSLAIVTVSIYYYAIMTGALFLAFFMMQVRSNTQLHAQYLMYQLPPGIMAQRTLFGTRCITAPARDNTSVMTATLHPWKRSTLARN